MCYLLQVLKSIDGLNVASALLLIVWRTFPFCWQIVNYSERQSQVDAQKLSHPHVADIRLMRSWCMIHFI